MLLSPLWEPDPGPAPSGGTTPVTTVLTQQFSNVSPCLGRWSGAPGQQRHLWLDMHRRWDPEDRPADEFSGELASLSSLAPW